MSDLIQHVRQGLLSTGLLVPGKQIILALSGGLDSVVLSHVFLTLARELGWGLLLAHYNHQLRGEASDSDEMFVRGLAERWKVGIEVGRGPVSTLALEAGMSVEMAARELRHQFLAQTARAHSATLIALAHHADDQVETFFVNLFRGSGSRGFAGMRLVSPSPADPTLFLLRPFLQVPRSGIQAYAKLNQLEFRQDETNHHVTILRNRIRQELIPLLEDRFQPCLREVVLRAMELDAGISDYMSDCARQWIQESPAGRPFSGLPLALQRAVVREQLLQHGYPMSFALIERLRNHPGKDYAVRADQHIQLDSSGRLHLNVLMKADFSLASLVVDLSASEGKVEFQGCLLEWAIQRMGPGGWKEWSCLGESVEVLDVESIGLKIELRQWRPGDRFQPSGMRKPAKLQDLFTNARVKAPEKRNRVLATGANNEIFWVEGLRIGEQFKCGPNTQNVLVWRWKRAQAAGFER